MPDIDAMIDRVKSHTSLDVYPDRLVVTKNDVITTQIDEKGEFADYPIVNSSFTYGSNPSSQGFPASTAISNHLIRLGKLRMLVFDTIQISNPSTEVVIFNSKIPAEDRPSQVVSALVDAQIGTPLIPMGNLVSARLDPSGEINLRYLDPDAMFVRFWRAERTTIPSFTLTWIVDW